MHYHGKNFFKSSWLFLTSLIDSSDIANSATLRMLPGSISPLSISRAVYAIMRSSPARWVPTCEPNNSWIFLRHYLTKWGRPISLRPLAVLKLLFCLCAFGLILKYQFSLPIAPISLTFLYAEKFTKFSLLLINPSKEKQAWLRHQILSIVISPLPLQILRSPDLFINQSINQSHRNLQRVYPLASFKIGTAAVQYNRSIPEIKMSWIKIGDRLWKMQVGSSASITYHKSTLWLRITA